MFCIAATHSSLILSQFASEQLVVRKIPIQIENRRHGYGVSVQGADRLASEVVGPAYRDASSLLFAARDSILMRAAATRKLFYARRLTTAARETHKA